MALQRSDFDDLFERIENLAKAPSRPKNGGKDPFLNWGELDDKSRYKMLCEVTEKSRHFPTMASNNLVREKCLLEQRLSLRRDAALTLLDCQALAFRHQSLSQYNKRIGKRLRRVAAQAKGCEDDEEEAIFEEAQREMLAFTSFSNERLLEMARNLPKNWRAVQITVDDIASVSRFKRTPCDKAIKENFALDIVCVECGEEELDEDIVMVHKVAAVENNAGQHPSIMQEFQDILELHVRIYRPEYDKAKYQKSRQEVDNRIDALIDTIENRWLGFYKVLLLGKPENSDDVKTKAENLVTSFFSTDSTFRSSGRLRLLSKILQGFELLNGRQVAKAINYLFDSHDDADVEAKERFRGCLKRAALELGCSGSASPVVLILDKNVQSLPWESLPCLNLHPVSRVPSFHVLYLLHKAHASNERPVSKDRIFYVINPDQNLAKTQARLEPTFASMSLGEGLVGQQPTLPKMQKVLSEMDAFMYCGHGSSLKHVSSQEIEKMRVRAVPLLFGCNSGRINRMGRHLDPSGAATYYLIAAAPSMLGFLWSITDKDVDAWTVDFLKYWLGDRESASHEFVRSVAEKRASFGRTINRAAAVVYGLPAVP